MRETVPTFLMRDGKRISDVFYTEWEAVDGTEWWLIPASLTVQGKGGDTLIFETPVGCFQMELHVTVTRDDTITISHGGGPNAQPLLPCQMPERIFDEEPPPETRRPTFIERIFTKGKP